MEVEFGDHESGFCHYEVIRFINNEILMNGGGPEFYLDFRLRPWNEVEDQLRAMVLDPQVPRPIKRACAWSALALSVRAAARQREQQVRRVRLLQEQVEEREAAIWALASELQRLRGEREEEGLQLRFTREALQRALNERDVLRGRLLHMETWAQGARLPMEIVSVPQAQPHRAAVWPQNAHEYSNTMALGAQGRLYVAAQMISPAPVLYMPRPLYLWNHVFQHPLPMPVLHSFPFHPPFPTIPYLPPLPPAVVMGTAAAAIPLQMPPGVIYPPCPWVAVGFQGQMAPMWDQRYYGREEGLFIPQGTAPLGNSRSYSQEKGSERPQEIVTLGDNGSHSQEKGPVRPQELAPVEDNKNHSQEEGPVKPPGMPPLVNSRSHSQEEGPVRPQGISPQGDTRSHSQEEGPVRPPGMPPLGNSRSHSQEEGPVRPQAITPLGDSRSHGVREGPKKQQPQGQKAKQPRGKKASEYQHQEKPVPGGSPANWDCLWCRAMNFSWRTACYKCKRVYMPGESGGLDPGQAPH
ncbi:putative testis-expressed protein 13C [Trichechus manatus latirostris]|uniref:Testis-expressed protein 13C n=1 Tax=Trichechus manatus latirostris TaxID=127582 RepID=A0A2Y9R689_TRIMA|nr:putative testis-expressed protein 13C [Trichechus manatus latirostris]